MESLSIDIEPSSLIVTIISLSLVLSSVVSSPPGGGCIGMSGIFVLLSSSIIFPVQVPANLLSTPVPVMFSNLQLISIDVRIISFNMFLIFYIYIILISS